MTGPALRPVPMRVIEEKLRGHTIYETEPVWSGPHVLKAQQSYSFTVKFEALVPSLGALLFGPQFGVAVAFSAIDPHWYLRGDFDGAGLWPA